MQTFTDLGTNGYDILEPLTTDETVFLARPSEMSGDDELVVVKVLDETKEPVLPKRFDRSRRTLDGLIEAGMSFVPLVDRGTTKTGREYIVTPHYPEGSLADLVENGPLPWRQAVELVLQAAVPVGRAHQAGLSLGDLRPSAIFIADDRCLISVYGSATRRFDNGAPSHRAPELDPAGKVTPGTDVYSLGSTLGALLAGRERGRAESTVSFLAGIGQHDGPQPVLDVIEQALSSDPGRRHRDASAFGRALDAALSGKAVAASPPESADMEPDPVADAADSPAPSADFVPIDDDQPVVEPRANDDTLDNDSHVIPSEAPVESDDNTLIDDRPSQTDPGDGEEPASADNEKDPPPAVDDDGTAFYNKTIEVDLDSLGISDLDPDRVTPSLDPPDSATMITPVDDVPVTDRRSGSAGPLADLELLFGDDPTVEGDRRQSPDGGELDSLDEADKSDDGEAEGRWEAAPRGIPADSAATSPSLNGVSDRATANDGPSLNGADGQPARVARASAGDRSNDPFEARTPNFVPVQRNRYTRQELGLGPRIEHFWLSNRRSVGSLVVVLVILGVAAFAVLLAANELRISADSGPTDGTVPTTIAAGGEVVSKTEVPYFVDEAPTAPEESTPSTARRLTTSVAEETTTSNRPATLANTTNETTATTARTTTAPTTAADLEPADPEPADPEPTTEPTDPPSSTTTATDPPPATKTTPTSRGNGRSGNNGNGGGGDN